MCVCTCDVVHEERQNFVCQKILNKTISGLSFLHIQTREAGIVWKTLDQFYPFATFLPHSSASSLFSYLSSHL